MVLGVTEKIDEKRMVTKGHPLVQAKGKMGALEQKIALSVISLINKEDTDLKNEYQIDIKDIQKLTGSSDKNFYKTVKETASSLMDRKILIEYETEKGKKKFFETRYLSSAEHTEGSGVINITIEKKLKPYLIQLSAFTQFQLKNVIKMKSGYAIRIYELLKQWPGKETKKLEMGHLREILGLEDEYTRFTDFERRVIKPAVKEINDKSDLKVSYEKVKVGKRIDAIILHYEEKEIDEKIYILEELDKNGLIDIEEIKEKTGLKSFKFNKKQIMELYEIAVEKYDEDPYNYLRNYAKHAESEKVKNKFAYIKKGLQEDWDMFSMINRKKYD